MVKNIHTACWMTKEKDGKIVSFHTAGNTMFFHYPIFQILAMFIKEK